MRRHNNQVREQHAQEHDDGFRDQEGPALVSWLQSQGARITAGFDDGDLLFALPR